MKSNLLNAFVIGIFFSLIVIGCSAYSEGKPAAEAGIAAFHEQLNEGKFEEMYDASDQKLKDATSKDDFIQFLSAIHTKLGNSQGSTSAGWNISNFNLVTTITINQKTEFEHGHGVETFVYEIADKKASLVSYHIDSKELIIK